MPAIFVKGGVWIAGVAATAVVTVAGVGTLAVRERQASLNAPALVDVPAPAKARGQPSTATAREASPGSATPAKTGVEPPAVVARTEPATPAPKALLEPAALETAKFDVLRIEPTGEAVIAGRAPEDSLVTLLDRSVAIAHVEVAASGEFVFLPPPLEAGEHELRLRISKAGYTQLSEESARVIVPGGTGGRFLVSLETPGAPPRIFADVDQPTPAKEASAPVLQAQPKPVAHEASAPAGPPPGRPLAALEPKIAAPPQRLAARDVPAAPTPSASYAPVAIRTIAVEADGSFLAIGTATPGSHVRLQLNGSPVAAVVADGVGHWSLRIEHGMRPGAYVLRAEDVTASGTVLSHADAPFDYRVPAAALPIPPGKVASAAQTPVEPSRGSASPGLVRPSAATPLTTPAWTTTPSGSGTPRAALPSTTPKAPLAVSSGNPPSSTPAQRPDVAASAVSVRIAPMAEAPSAAPKPRFVVSLEPPRAAAAPVVGASPPVEEAPQPASPKPAALPAPTGAPKPVEAHRSEPAAPDPTFPEKPEHRLVIVAEREPDPALRHEASSVNPAASQALARGEAAPSPKRIDAPLPPSVEPATVSPADRAVATPPNAHPAANEGGSPVLVPPRAAAPPTANPVPTVTAMLPPPGPAVASQANLPEPATRPSKVQHPPFATAPSSGAVQPAPTPQSAFASPSTPKTAVAAVPLKVPLPALTKDDVQPPKAQNATAPTKAVAAPAAAPSTALLPSPAKIDIQPKPEVRVPLKAEVTPSAAPTVAIPSPKAAQADVGQPSPPPAQPPTVKHPAAVALLSQTAAPPPPASMPSASQQPSAMATLASSSRQDNDNKKPTAGPDADAVSPSPTAAKQAVAPSPPLPKLPERSSGGTVPAEPAASPARLGAAPVAATPLPAPAAAVAPHGPAQNAVMDLSAASMPPVASPSAAEMSTPADAVVPELQTTLVQPGDSLWSLSQKLYGDATQFVRIYEANADQIYDPWLIYPGQILVVPNPPAK